MASAATNTFESAATKSAEECTDTANKTLTRTREIVKELARLQEENTRLKKELEDCKANFEVSENTVSKNVNKIFTLESDNGKLQEALEDMTRERDAKMAETKTKDDAIGGLNAQIEKLKSTVKENGNTLKENQTQITNLKSEVSSLTELLGTKTLEYDELCSLVLEINSELVTAGGDGRGSSTDKTPPGDYGGSGSGGGGDGDTGGGARNPKNARTGL